MSKYRSLFYALLALVIPVSGWAQDDRPQPLGTLPHARLLYIDDTVLYVADFGDYLQAAGAIPSGRRDRDLDTLYSSLETYIDKNVIIRDMDTVAMLSDGSSRHRMRWRMAHAAGPVVFRQLIAPHIQVSDSAVEQFYRDSSHSLFTAPHKREVRQILISPSTEPDEQGKRIRTRQDIEKAQVLADSLLQEIRGGASFESVARAFSDDSASSQQNGYIGWIYPGNTPLEFDQAVFAGAVGEVVGPVKTLYGYHLIKIEAERPESTIAFNDSLSTLIRMYLERAEGVRLGSIWSDSMIAATAWRYNDPALENLREAPDSAWMVVIGGRDTLRYEEWKGAWEFYRRTQKVEGDGTLEDKHSSLRKTGFPFLYLIAADKHGFMDDPVIQQARIQYLQSEAVRLAHTALGDLQSPPDSVIKAEAEARIPEPEADDGRSLHLQIIRARDTASIWSAYRALVAGKDMETVARRYHDNLREARSRGWDLGWVGASDIPAGLWGPAWILNEGSYTRPIEDESRYYIVRLVERKRTQVPEEQRVRAIDQVRSEFREQGLVEWRKRIRSGHHIRLDRGTWKRVQQLWRP